MSVFLHLGSPRPLLLGLLAAVLLAGGGCRAKQIDGTYGKRRGTPGGESVNGTRVLGEMFSQAGYRVTTRRYLSPRMNDYDVIVWAPDDFDLPDAEAVEFLENWLRRGRQRTLVYIGRDYDAQITYWEDFLFSAAPDQNIEILRRLARARAAHARARAGMPQDEQGDWFRVRRDADRRVVGQDPQPEIQWTGAWGERGFLQAAELAARLHGRLEPPSQRAREKRSRAAAADWKADSRPPAASRYQSEILLAADDDILAFRLTRDDWPGGQLVVVANGSFLLNLPLVEQGHRKLAGQLIRDCGSAQKVAFLESGPEGLSILQQDPRSNYPTGLEAFTVWPLGGILWHFLALGIVFLFARLMVFGRPQELPPEEVSDFGRHVQSFGELLASTGDEQYARHQLARYHETMQATLSGVCSSRGPDGRATGESEPACPAR